MDYTKQIIMYLDKSGGIITAKICRDNNIPTVYLSRLIDQGFLRRVYPGIYITENGDYDEYYFFQYRFRKSIFSYETALHLLGITDKIPQKMEVTVMSSYKFNKKIPRVEVHYVKKEWYELGVIDTKTMFGNPVRVYSFERILCDFIMYKEEIDPEIYITTIRAFRTYAKRDIHKLYQIASKLGITSKVRDIMEVAFE